MDNGLVEDERQGDPEVEDGESLRAQVIRQDFDGVRDNQGRIGDVIPFDFDV